MYHLFYIIYGFIRFPQGYFAGNTWKTRNSAGFAPKQQNWFPCTGNAPASFKKQQDLYPNGRIGFLKANLPSATIVCI